MTDTVRYYIGATAIAGLFGLTYGWLNVTHVENLTLLTLLVVLCAVSQSASVPLFSGSSVSISFAISFISLLLFGPVGGITANLGAAAMHAVFPTRRPWYKVVFNTSVLVASMAAASATYILAGGHTPPSDIVSSAFPVAAATLVYFIVNTTLVSLAVSLSTGANFQAIFNESHRWLILHYVTAAAISLLAASGYESMGWPGLLVFSLPLVMPWASTRMYVAQTKTVNQRNADLVRVNAQLEEANLSLQRRIEENARLYEQVHDSYLSTIAALVATVEAKDPYTRGHSERVKDYAIAAGLEMKLSSNELRTLELAALFHDIGKIGISENILGKLTPLTDEEWRQIRRHPIVAESILKHVPTLAAAIPIIRAHHERYDGTGYPDGLSKGIPKLSAIISVADAYDAMASERPYRKAMSKEYAKAELQSGAGTQFDPAVVKALLRGITAEQQTHSTFLMPEVQFAGAPSLSNLRIVL